ncbi:hypothetical protein D3C72_2355820 [compost metagenome]
MGEEMTFDAEAGANRLEVAHLDRCAMNDTEGNLKLMTKREHNAYDKRHKRR